MLNLIVSHHNQCAWEWVRNVVFEPYIHLTVIWTSTHNKSFIEHRLRKILFSGEDTPNRSVSLLSITGLSAQCWCMFNSDGNYPTDLLYLLWISLKLHSHYTLIELAWWFVVTCTFPWLFSLSNEVVPRWQTTSICVSQRNVPLVSIYAHLLFPLLVNIRALQDVDASDLVPLNFTEKWLASFIS